VYLHIQQWPGETLTLPVLPAKVVRSRVLTGGQAVVTQAGDRIEITLPASDRQEIDTVVALDLEGSADGIEPLDVRIGSHSLAAGKKATASNVFQGNAGYGADKAFDEDGETRWATDSGTTSAWLEVELGRPATIGRAVIEQAFPELKRVRKFAIEYWQDDQWKPCYRGENLGAKLYAEFDPVTAQRVRLNITEATDGPTIWDFGLLSPKTGR
jgi:alpha-L-fucosidase